MSALTLADAKLALELVSTGLEASPIPEPFKSAVSAVPKIALTIVAMVEGAKKSKEVAEELAVFIANLCEAMIRAMETKGTRPITPELKVGVAKFTAELERVSENMKKFKSRNPFKRHIGFSEDALKVASFKERIATAMGLLQLENLLAVRVAVESIRQEQIDQGQRNQSCWNDLLLQGEYHLIERLGSGDTGSGDKERACVDRTRENALQEIEALAEAPEPSGSRILWLTGPAGTGKSAIVASMEARLREKGQLGAVFYFVQEQPARNKQVILELARQFTFHQPSLRAKIVDAVKADLDLPRKLVAEQYRRLFHEPLSSLPADHKPIVILIDALDECDEEYITTILRQVVISVKTFPSIVRFVLSSRVETYIRAILQSRELESIICRRSLDNEKLDVPESPSSFGCGEVRNQGS